MLPFWIAALGREGRSPKVTMTPIPKSTRPVESPTPDNLYGRDYYHGEGSGYSSEGYSKSHQDWTPWLDFVTSLAPGPVLVDVGTAYGYLPAEARRRGFFGYGVDISSYGLTQEPEFSPFLAQSGAARLPVRTDSADVVCLFDVLEHLTDPLEALSEARRILKPDGMIIGATPDPIFFQRDEPTHCFERPPAFWLEALADLDLVVGFRFSVEPYNFQFLAGYGNSATRSRIDRFNHDYFEAIDDFVRVEGPLTALPRAGWSELHDGTRAFDGGRASIYLHNSSAGPLSLTARFTARSDGFSTLRVSWNSQVLAEFSPGSEPLHGRLELPAFDLPEGGHHLFFRSIPSGPQVRISAVELKAATGERDALTLGLPFDLYQRYRMAADIARRLGPDSILDFGGYIGDQDGHLATSADFFSISGCSVVSADVRQCDLPSHLPLTDNASLPDGLDFDLVVCLDVLEHVPARDRLDFLADLDRLARRWILLAAPTASNEVETAEDRLREHLMSARRFLSEHKEHGLPRRSLVEGYFKNKKGYEVLSLPNGWLPHWIEAQVQTQHYFSFNDYRTNRLFNTWCNTSFYESDLREPSYRSFYLISKDRGSVPSLRTISREHRTSQIDEGAVDHSGDYLELHEHLLEVFERRSKNATDAYFLLQEREKHIAILKQTIQNLEELVDEPLTRIAWRRLRGGR